MAKRSETPKGFLPVVLSSPTSWRHTEDATVSKDQAFTIELETPEGFRLRLSNEFSAAALVRLLAALRASC